MTACAEAVRRALYGDMPFCWPEAVDPGVEGWNGNHPALKALVTPSRPILIDVGVWKGQSTIAMASELRRQGIDGCVIAVDTFLGSAEHWGMGDAFLRRNGVPDIYERFLGNVRRAELTGYVVPLPQTSATAAAILLERGIRPHLIHIDAGHGYHDVVGDCREWWAMLGEGGVLAGDDYVDGWPGVQRAVDEHVARTGGRLCVDAPKWWIERRS